MAEEDNIMSEIKVMVFNGNLAKCVKSPSNNIIYQNSFLQEKGYTVQQFSYNCEMNRDTVNTIYGQTGNVIVDFVIRVMNNEQSLFYGKLKDLGSDVYSFVCNAVFENGKLRSFDNGIMVDGFVVDVDEAGSNDASQAQMNVKLLARQISYVHRDGSQLDLNISNHENK
jgi:hypothetical protein